MNDLKLYLPPLYNDVVEMNALLSAEGVVFGNADAEAQNALKDQFIQTATNYGISLFEDVLGIVPNPSTESWEYRRLRLLSRMSANPPFTEEFLIEHLTNVIGTGNFTVAVHHATYTVEARILIPAKTFFTEAQLFLLEVVPANMLIDLSIKYNSHHMLSFFTHEALAIRTYYELREELLLLNAF